MRFWKRTLLCFTLLTLSKLGHIKTTNYNLHIKTGSNTNFLGTMTVNSVPCTESTSNHTHSANTALSLAPAYTVQYSTLQWLHALFPLGHALMKTKRKKTWKINFSWRTTHCGKLLRLHHFFKSLFPFQTKELLTIALICFTYALVWV